MGQRARQQFVSVAAERDALKAELADMRRQRDDAIDCLRELRAAHAAVVATKAELASLYRERELMRALRVERDDALLLN